MADLKTSLTFSFKDEFSKVFKRLQLEFGKLTPKQKEQTKNTEKSTKANKKNALSFESLAKRIAGAGIAYKALQSINVASQFEQAKIDLSTVLGEKLDSKELESFFKETQNIAKKGLVDFQTIANTQYNLISAGLNKTIINSATNTVLEVSKVTKGSADEVASIMATASKNFNEDMGRVGDVLAKTQAKFQFANFNQLGQGFANVGASAASVKLPLEQTATALGMLNDAGVTGANAGTALNAVLRQLNKASEELGIDIVRSANGSLDLVATLNQIDKATNDLDLDEKGAVFQEIFGDEGKRGLLPLIAQLGKMKGNLEDVTKNSEGFAGKEAQKHYASFAVKMQGLKNSIMILTNAFAKHMLPVLINLINIIVPILTNLEIFMNNNPLLAKTIFAVTIAIGALVTAGVSLKIFAFMVSPLKIFRIALITLVSPLKLVRFAMVALRLAFLSTPIGWVVAGLTALVTIGVILYKKFEPVRKLFDAIAKPFASIANSIKKVFGGGNKELKQTSQENINTSVATEPLVDIPKATANESKSSSKGTTNVTYNNTFNIQGVSANEVVNLVLKKLNKQALGAM